MGSALKSEHRNFLFKVLAKAGLLTPLNIQMLSSFMDRWDLTAYHAILSTKLVSESDLADAIASHLGLNRLFHCETLPIEIEVLRLIPFAQARSLECLPVSLTEGQPRRLELVAADPTRRKRLEQLISKHNVELTLAVSERSDIVGAIDELYPLSEQIPALFGN